VPQFIDVEDKIIGPITAWQFIIMLVGSIIIAIFYKIFDFALFVASGLLILAVTGIIAFLKINGRPFHYFILNLIQTLKKPRLRIWYYNIASASDYGVEESRLLAAKKQAPGKHYTSSRLAELSLIVDTKGAYQGEGDNGGVKIIERKL